MYFVVLLAALVVCAAGVPLSSTQPKPDGRILNGEEVNIRNFPYQLSLWVNGKFKCGAVIISEQWALTAAHCVHGETGNITVRAGFSLSGICHTDMNMYLVERFITHDSYNVTKLTFGNVTSVAAVNDIALLKVKHAFRFDRYINSIPLATSKVIVGTTATVTGFGYFNATHQKSKDLRKAVLEVRPREECLHLVFNDAKFQENTICTNASKPQSTGLCNGDSGGPLVAADDKLIGIASISDGDCDNDTQYSSFTDVFAMLDWINLTQTNNK